jgi:hypothetical protein
MKRRLVALLVVLGICLQDPVTAFSAGTAGPAGAAFSPMPDCAKLGVKTDIGERVLNHARERIEATYDVHGYIDEKREALEKWAKYLAGLCSRVAP